MKKLDLLSIITILTISVLMRGSYDILFHIPVIIFIYFIICLKIWDFKPNDILEKKCKYSSEIIWTALLIVNIIFSFFIASYKYPAFIKFNQILSYILFYFLLKNVLISKEYFIKIFKYLVYFAFIISVFGLLQYLNIISHNYWAHKQFMSSVYVNHNHFAGFLEMMIPICFALLFMENKKNKIIFSVISVILMISMILTLSRGGWICFLLSSFIFLLVYFRHYKYKWQITGVFIILVLSFICIISFCFPESDLAGRMYSIVLQVNNDTRELSRIHMWEGTVSLIKEHPLGVGLGQFVWEFPRYRHPSLVAKIVHAHNDYLHFTAELGMFFILFITAFIFKLVKKFIYMYKHNAFKNNLVALSCFCGIFSILLHSIIDFNLHIPANVYLFVLLFYGWLNYDKT